MEHGVLTGITAIGIMAIIDAVIGIVSRTEFRILPKTIGFALIWAAFVAGLTGTTSGHTVSWMIGDFAGLLFGACMFMALDKRHRTTQVKWQQVAAAPRPRSSTGRSWPVDGPVDDVS